MKAIVNVDKNWGIGSGDSLLFHLPGDMRFFKNTTINNVVVMGKTTFLTFPNQQPLKDRVNIVLTRDRSFSREGIVVCHSIDEVLEETKKYIGKEVFVIGGASVYEQFLPFCDEVIATKVRSEKPCDKYFPNLDKTDCFEITGESETFTEKDVDYNFVTYKRVK